MKYEIRIKEPSHWNKIDKLTTDNLIVSLVRYGYAVYISDDNEVCFSVLDDEFQEIKEE
jgi:hypothetical protein